MRGRKTSSSGVLGSTRRGERAARLRHHSAGRAVGTLLKFSRAETLHRLMARCDATVAHAPDLLAGAFAVTAPRPAARPTHPFLKLLLGSANAAFSGHLLLGILDPADELVAGQRRYVVPGIERPGVADQRLTQVCGQLVHHATGHSRATHKTTVAAILDANETFRPARPWGSEDHDTRDIGATVGCAMASRSGWGLRVSSPWRPFSRRPQAGYFSVSQWPARPLSPRRPSPQRR